MGYLVGDGTAAKPVIKMLIGNGAGGTVPIKKVMAGTGTSAVEVWPGKRIFRDDFERPDQLLTRPDWITWGNSPYFLWVLSGNARIFDNETDGLRSSWTFRTEDTITDVQYSKGKIVHIGHEDRETHVCIHANALTADQMGFRWAGNTLQLFTRIAGVNTNRGASASKTQVVGDWLEIRTSVHPTTGVATYGGYVNGVLYCVWPDTAGVVKRGAQLRRVGFGMQRDRFLWKNTLSTQFSEWEGGDL